MDILTLRAVITVVAFVTFLAIVAWAYSARRRSRFEEAAWLPFESDDAPDSGRFGRGDTRTK